MSNLRKCPYCNSVLVNWNWMIAWGGDMDKFAEMNPHIPPEELKPYGHECWSCENCHETKDEIKDGIPYEELLICTL